MPLRDRAPFYAALQRFTSLRRTCAPDVPWAPDGTQIATGPARPATGTAAQRRTFLRETYLVPEFPAPEAPSPDGRWFASVQGGELHLRGARGQPDRTLTTGATDAIAWDLETLGVNPWSPDGRWLLANRMDRSGVWRDVRTRFDEEGRVRVDHPRVQRAGEPIDVPQPHLVPAGGGPALAIDLGDMRDQFLRLVGWIADASGAVLLRLSRRLDRAELFVVDAADGRVRRILEERSPTFLRRDSVIWVDPTGCDLIDGRRFLWQSERDGWNHLYLGHLDAEPSEALVQLTRGQMGVHDVVRCDGGVVWFRAREEGARPYDLNLYAVPLQCGAVRRLTEGDGEHEIEFSPDASQFVDTFSTPGVPPRRVLRRADGTHVAELSLPDPAALLGAGWTAPLEVVVTAADGRTALHGVLYRPAGFDPGRRYPLLHWVYGGPQLCATPRTFAPRNDSEVLHHALADSGYLVLVLDARGTPQRSKSFQDVVWRSFVDHVVADQASALRQLIARHPWIDPKRIGVLGRSWGATFALHLLAAAPDLYRAASCTVPGFDPYGGLITEPYLGLPQDNPEPYRAFEPWALPQRIDKDARVLLMAGMLDSPQQWNLQRMSQLLVEADISHQTLVFAEQEHVFEGSALRFHQRALRDFFDEALA